MTDTMTREELAELLDGVKLQYGESVEEFWQQMDRVGTAVTVARDNVFIKATLTSVWGPRVYAVVLSSSRAA